MAGIGVKLNKIFDKRTLATHMVGFGYSAMVTIAPMIGVIGCLVLMEHVLGFSKVGYAARELFSCTILYIFIFALLTASPFNAVLSRYMSDVIYEERYQDILPCYYVGLVLNIILSCIVGIPFCLWEHFGGGVSIAYTFCGFCGYISMVFVFYSMLYLSICKDYQKISIYFGVGMLTSFLLSVILRFVFHWGVTQSMLLALTVGFFVIAVLEHALIHRYFGRNSNRYRAVFSYFRKYGKLVVVNFLYILGLYIHNFVFWTTDLRITVARSFVSNQPYDMASCLGMFTCLSATVIFIARVEMHFHEKYKMYSEAVIGGRWSDIMNTKRRMFRQLSGELMNLARIQFMISVVIYLLCIVLLPRIGFSGMILQIYPCLAAGYFVLFLMYSAIIFLYYFDDLTGALWTAILFCTITLIGSMIATYLPVIWYGSGLLEGAFAGWCVAYGRLRWVERHMDAHVFCRGTLIPYGKGTMPSGMVYKKTDAETNLQEEKVGEK